MPLNASSTAADIANALKAAHPDLDVTKATTEWTIIINALYTRIKADMQVQTQVTGVQSGGSTATGTSTTIT